MYLYSFILVLLTCSIDVCGFTSKIIKKSLLLPSKNPAKYNIIVFPGFDKKPYSYKNLCD